LNGCRNHGHCHAHILSVRLRYCSPRQLSSTKFARPPARGDHKPRVAVPEMYLSLSDKSIVIPRQAQRLGSGVFCGAGV
jgi:hypothetical protein